MDIEIDRNTVSIQNKDTTVYVYKAQTGFRFSFPVISYRIYLHIGRQKDTGQIKYYALNVFNPPLFPEIQDPARLKVGDIYKLPIAWRGEPYRFGRFKETLLDILYFEASELGNIDVIMDAIQVLARHNIDPTKVPGKEALWISPFRDVALKYSDPPIEIDMTSVPYLIIAKDDEDGYLVIPYKKEYAIFE